MFSGEILVQHIRIVLPALKARLNTQMVTVVKELRSYGDVIENNDERRLILLSIITRYCEAFSSMIEGNYQEMWTTELFGGARILYIFQSIFVKRLEEIDPCDDLTDDEIRTAIQNATGTKTALFVPEVPFEVLVRRRIARLLDPSLQCLSFVYDELIKISHACTSIDLQRFPVLGKRLEEVVAKFLRDGKRPAERMIMNIVEMEMDYVNTSHPNFIGGSKAVDIVSQQMKSQKLAAVTAARLKEIGDNEKHTMSEKTQKTRGFTARSAPNGVAIDQDLKPLSSNERPTSSTGITSAGSWGFSSIFGSSENRGYTDKPTGNTISDSLPIDLTFSTIRLKEPPSILRPSDKQTENEASEIAITKLLLRSYYDIVRKNIQDSVPKAIMHFLVNHAKRQLLSTFIQKVYREEQFGILLNEREEVAIKRRRIMEMYHVLQQAVSTLDELPIDLDEASYSRSGTDVAARRSGSMSSNHSASNGDIHEMAHTTAPPLKNQRRHKSTDSWEKTQPSFSSD